MLKEIRGERWIEVTVLGESFGGRNGKGAEGGERPYAEESIRLGDGEERNAAEGEACDGSARGVKGLVPPDAGVAKGERSDPCEFFRSVERKLGGRRMKRRTRGGAELG